MLCDHPTASLRSPPTQAPSLLLLAQERKMWARAGCAPAVHSWQGHQLKQGGIAQGWTQGSRERGCSPSSASPPASLSIAAMGMISWVSAHVKVSRELPLQQLGTDFGQVWGCLEGRARKAMKKSPQTHTIYLTGPPGSPFITSLCA